MIVPFSGRPTADMVRVPVGGRFVTVFAAIFGSQANRALSSCPRSIRHTDFTLAAGVEWIGDKHHTIHYRPFSVTGNRSICLTFCLPRQPFGFGGGKVDGGGHCIERWESVALEAPSWPPEAYESAQ